MLPVLLTCLARMSTGNACWCWRMVRRPWSVAVLRVESGKIEKVLGILPDDLAGVDGRCLPELGARSQQ